jgi:uncharacterized membrane protein
VSRHEWLLLIHVGGAFCVLAGALLAVVLNRAAVRRERPSEIALLLGLTRVAVVLIAVGMIVTLVFGLWLVDDTPEFDLGDAWISASLGLWVTALVLGSTGGRRDRETRKLAEQLAADGNHPSDALAARLHDPVSIALSYGSGAAVIAIVVLMIWRPGG